MTATQLWELAGLLADRSRAAFCLALLDGRCWTVGELARHAEIGPSTASEHVATLVAGGIVSSIRQGRHRYVRLADAGAAQLIEDLVGYAPQVPLPGSPGPRSLRAASSATALARARTCYDHLAGRLGVRITDAMTGAGLLDQAAGFAVTPAGLAWLESELGVDVTALTAARRPVARSCLDWTERRPHLGGAAGAAVCERFFAHGWIVRVGSARAVRVTAAGQQALLRLLRVDLTADAA